MKTDYLQILKEELLPALGCTEPIALAYGAADCRRLLGEDPVRIAARCSGNIIKNVKGVVVPNCGGMKGIDTAVVAGALYGDSSKGLEVLSSVTSDKAAELCKDVKRIKVEVSLLETEAKLHFIISMEGKDHSASVEIIHQHLNVVKSVKDGDVVFFKAFEEKEMNTELADRSGMNIADIISFAENAPLEELEEIIAPQIRCNKAISKEGLENPYGAEVGRVLMKAGNGCLYDKMAAAAAAGSDARMSGCSMPVIINSGSGNQGMTVSLPVIVYAEEMGFSHEKLVRALVLSNLSAIHQKTRIGRLSAYCGAVSAAAGAAAAISWLDNGSIEQIDDTIVNTLATVSGMICDGAKPSCAGKIAVAVNAALLAHDMAMSGHSYRSGDGIVKDDVEKTVSGVGQIASDGMSETDSVILSVMLGC